MRTIDWSSTSLGDPDRWPQSLRTMLRMLLTSRYQMWMGWGPDLNFFYNDAYRPTLGAKHPQSLGAPTRELWAEIWADIAPRIERVLSTGEATWDQGLLLLLERNGYAEETYHTFSYSPLFTDSGVVGGMLCVVTEETERVISERRLAFVRELSSRIALAKTTDDVMAAVVEAWPVADRDLPFTLTYLFDESMRRATLVAYTGIDADNAAATPQIDLESGLTCAWPIQDMLAQRSAVLVDPLPSGFDWPSGPWARQPGAAMMVPIAQRGEAQPAGVFITGVNPHRPCDEGYRSFLHLFVGQIAAGLANVRAYEAEQRRAEALAEIDRAKTVFFSNVSHEFRTPLTLMLGPLDDLATRGDVAPDVREQLTMVRRNGARLQRLVNTLLDFSRIEAGRVQATFEPVELGEYTRDLASVFQSATQRAGLRFTVTAPPLGQPVYVDRTMWENIVLNLISNAFKYTLDGGIEVLLQGEDNCVHLSVRDSGVGISAADLPRLFDRFHRVEGSGGRSHEGSGIGLALVQELVTLHGGTIAVESEVGRGSTFTVTLPRGDAHLPAQQIRQPAAAPRPDGASRFLDEALQWLPAIPGLDAGHPVVEELPPSAASNRQRILVADDNADMRHYVASLLKPRWDVTVVASGREALASVRAARPDLVISDIMMPELDGFGVVKALRDDPHTRDVPVLLLSARAGEEARIEGLAAGASDYLVKPFSGRELIARADAQLLRARIRAVEEAHTRRLTSVFAQAPVAIAIVRGPEHVIELVNGPGLDIVGRRDIVGRPVREALPEIDSLEIAHLLDSIYRSGQPYTVRSHPISVRRGVDDRAEQRFFDVVLQPLLSDDGAAEGIAAVAYDVTELARARQAAEVANQAKDEFLAMLGHELRNPLAPILTALQLLRLRGLSTAERERQVIERQVKHLVSLVDDLLDISRITRGKIQLKSATVELSEIVAKSIETASPLLEQKAHQLQVDVPRHGLAVYGDADRLAQVVSNLLTNAAKYTETGGRIAISATSRDGTVVLEVSDTGIGIAPDMLPRIFDLFVQERQALDRAQGGLGLGLAIVRSLIELHGGSVDARSKGLGRGATFAIRLPQAVTAPPTGDAVALQDQTRTPGVVRRVLVVDDNEDAAAMLAEALLAYGHVSRTAADGLEALRVAESFDPDIALLDIGLPVIDGYELARRFAEHAQLRRVRLIALTGYGQEQDRQRSLAAGFTAHLVKPIDVEQLRVLLESPFASSS